METKDKEFRPFNIDIWKHDGHAGALIPLLQSAQDTYGYVSERAIDYISHVTGIPPAEIYGVVTFYAQFRTKPLGEKVIKVCNGTACHVNGVKEIANTLSDELGINYEETTEDGKFVAGAAALEMELGPRLSEYASSVGGREQLAIDKFAKA